MWASGWVRQLLPVRSHNISARIVIEMKTGGHLVEFFPILNHVPRSLAKWKREAEDFFISYSKVFEGMYTEIQARVVRAIFTLVVFQFH